MNGPGGKSRNLPLRQLVCGVILAAGAMGVLESCQSPMQSDVYDKNWGRYADSLLTRAVVDGTLASMTPTGLTENHGVRELVSVAADDAAVVPAGTAPMDQPLPPAATRACLSEDAISEEGAATQPTSLGEEQNIIRLSLEDALARTLEHSLAIKVEAYNPGIKEAQITEALAVPLDPVLFGDSQYNYQDEPLLLTSSQLNGANWANSVGIKQLLPSGGTAQIGTGFTYRDFQNKNLVTPNSSYAPNINVAISQPLLRGFGSNVTLANTYLGAGAATGRIALTQFRRQVIQSVADVEEAYLNLVLARSAADIQSRLLANTEDTFHKILARQPVDADRVQI